MIALITYGLKKEEQNTIKYFFVYFYICCICDPCIHTFLNVAKKTRTLSYAKKGQPNSVASCARFSKDRLEKVQKHIIKRHL